MEVSSANSRLAPSGLSSPSVMIPFGIDHAPLSFLAQNGPPGCTRKTSRPLPERRYIKSPALVCGIAEFPLLCPALQFLIVTRSKDRKIGIVEDWKVSDPSLHFEIPGHGTAVVSPNYRESAVAGPAPLSIVIRPVGSQRLGKNQMTLMRLLRGCAIKRLSHLLPSIS